MLYCRTNSCGDVWSQFSVQSQAGVIRNEIPPACHVSADFVFDITRTPTRTPSDVPYLDRVRAMCAVMGVGVLKVKDAGHEAVEAAISSLQTGEAVQSNAYADGLDVRI